MLHTGPVLPDVRQPAGGRIGVDITLGKTDATSIDELLQRYAYIASTPEGQVQKVRGALGDMALSALLRGAAASGCCRSGCGCCWAGAVARAVPPRAPAPAPGGRPGAAGGRRAVVGALDRRRRRVVEGQRWMSLAEFLGSRGDAAGRGQDLEVRGDVTTEQTRRLIESAISTYDQSKTFYTQAAEDAAALDLRAAGRRRDRGAAHRRPPRQHRHGPGGACGRRRRGSDGGVRRGRRHVGRQDVGDVQPGLRHGGLRRVRAVRRGRQPRPRHVRAHLPRRPRLDHARRRRRSPDRPASGCSASTTRAPAAWATGATRPGSASTRSAAGSPTPPASPRTAAAGWPRPGARRQPRRRGAGPRLRGPGRRRPHPRPGRPGPGDRRRTTRSATPTRRVRRVGRRTPSPSAASPAVPPA